MVKPEDLQRLPTERQYLDLNLLDNVFNRVTVCLIKSRLDIMPSTQSYISTRIQYVPLHTIRPPVKVSDRYLSLELMNNCNPNDPKLTSSTQGPVAPHGGLVKPRPLSSATPL
jgi:hypothetical protein